MAINLLKEVTKCGLNVEVLKKKQKTNKPTHTLTSSINFLEFYLLSAVTHILSK